MAFDGFVLAAVSSELKTTIEGGIVSKVAMPEKDELLILIRNNSNNYRLLISAGASLPVIYLTEDNKPSPLTAPAFCMLLRKYLNGAKIRSVAQNGLERVLQIEFEHRDDLGDISVKKLVFEIMGKYSNIIFVNHDNIILDSIKRVPSSVSSLREVLPGRKYVFPDELKKRQPSDEDRTSFFSLIHSSDSEIYKVLYRNYAGFSPLMSQEVCARAGIDGDMNCTLLSESEIDALYGEFESLRISAEKASFMPTIVFRNNDPVEFSAFSSVLYDSDGYIQKIYSSISLLLDEYYSAKDRYNRMRQKTADLRKTVINLIERASRKYDLQSRQLKDCSEKDKYKVFGDLINTYGYSLSGGESSFECNNYYDNDNPITIPLDPNRSAAQNSKKYYDRYSKLRRTETVLKEEIRKTSSDINQLECILQSLNTSASEDDILQIRSELASYGFLTSGNGNQKKKIVSKPIHIVSDDGYDIYIGKNNYQNEEVTFKIAGPDDWWFHAKSVPGSHVIVKSTDTNGVLPDKVFNQAAALAAFYSKNKEVSGVEVDYTQRRNLKKTSGGPPGFVIYHTYYSMVADDRFLIKI